MSKKIAIVGFAPSRERAPYGDKSWEIWGVNDLYHYVPRCDVIFEVHHLLNLGKRRNPKHEEFLRTTDRRVFMLEADPNYPTAEPLPRAEVFREFDAYITNSISWMLAVVFLENSSVVDLDGRKVRLAHPDVEVGIWGVDMAADSEYGSQRPSCEYWVGMGLGMGFRIGIAEDSDLCKAQSLYGYETTAPLRIKAQSQIEALRGSKTQLAQQEAQLLAQLEQAKLQKAQFQGAIDTWKTIMRNWTMPTDIQQGEAVEAKDRGAPMEGAPASNGEGAVEHLVEVTDG